MTSSTKTKIEVPVQPEEMKYAGVLCATTAFLVAVTLALPSRAKPVSVPNRRMHPLVQLFLRTTNLACLTPPLQLKSADPEAYETLPSEDPGSNPP